jgi:hypothetical protein
MKSVWGTKRWAAATAVLLLLGGATCTKLLDHSAQRCTVDEDCHTYSDYHPFCTDHVCVASGLNPANCFYAPSKGTPVSPDNFLNQCSTGWLSPRMDQPTEACLDDDKKVDVDAGITMPGPRDPATGNNGTRPTANCKDLVPPGKSPVYISGSSNFQALLKSVTPAIIKLRSLVPIFRITTSCNGAHSMNLASTGTSTATTFVADHVIKDPAATSSEAYAQIFLGNDSNGVNQEGVNCLLGTAGVAVDVGESEIYPESCDGPPNTSNVVSEVQGPVLPLVFVVPPTSPEQAISYATARQVFGNGGFPPWDNPQQIFVRANGTATLRLLAKELDLTPTQVWGLDPGSASLMALKVGMVTDPEFAPKTIGILGTDLYDGLRGNLKVLAFQAKGQRCAYVPDSKLGRRDKLNVRDGHYPLWGRFHFFTGHNTNGTALSEVADGFVYEMTTANLDPDIFKAFVTANLVPTCAMRVKRRDELGDVSVDDPAPYSCGCAFDMIAERLDHAPEGCDPCTVNDDCMPVVGKPYCNYNFCEAKQ